MFRTLLLVPIGRRDWCKITQAFVMEMPRTLRCLCHIRAENLGAFGIKLETSSQ